MHPPDPDRMVSRMAAPPNAPMPPRHQRPPGPPPGPGAPAPGAPISAARPPFKIQIMASDGAELVEFTEQDGMLVVRGDESRWDEGARRFLYAMLQWSGQVGIRWKDEAIETGES